MPSSVREAEGLIPLPSPVSRGRHTLHYSAQLTGRSFYHRSWFSLVKDRVYLRTCLKVSHVRFREDRWDSSYRIYKDIQNKSNIQKSY